MPSAAFFRLEGVLLRRSAIACAAWLAARQRDVPERLLRLGVVGLAQAVNTVGDTEIGLRAAFGALVGCSEDRLIVLAEQYVRDVALPAINPTGVALISQARSQGYAPVLLAAHPEPIATALAAHLGIEHVRCNRLELAHNNNLTGRLQAPLLQATIDGAWLREQAAHFHLDASRFIAYGAASTDALMLSAAPLPCAVTPDFRLRRLANQCGWPIVEASR